jgi:hypothetical protein
MQQVIIDRGVLKELHYARDYLHRLLRNDLIPAVVKTKIEYEIEKEEREGNFNYLDKALVEDISGYQRYKP